MMPTNLEDKEKAVFVEVDGEIAKRVYVVNPSGGGGPSTDVNITNGAGASAVNIQDGGNSITVDGTVTAVQSSPYDINLPPNASTETKQIEGNNLLTSIISTLTANAINKDFFGNGVVSSLHNQIEVPLDDSNYTDYATLTTANGGGSSQANGQVTLSTGTNVNGASALISKDAVKYRPGNEIGFGFTWRFPEASISGVTRRIGPTDSVVTWANSVYLSQSNNIFSLVYRRGNATIFDVQQSSWLDKCDGVSGSEYKNSAGNPVALDPTKDQLARVHCGLFGHAGFTVEILAPNLKWVTIYKHTNLNSQTVPVFENFDLFIGAEVKKTAAGTGVYTLQSACWAGWTGSSFQRLNSTITDRTLAQVTRTVIEGKTSAGGGGYVPVKVTPSGALTTETSISGTVAISATSLPLPTGASTETTLQNVLTSVDGVETKLDSLLIELQQKTEPGDSQNIRSLTFVSDKVDVSGSTVALDSASLSALENINVTVSNEVEIKNDVNNPIPISVNSLPLPSGAATSANQVTANASLSSIDSKLTAPLSVTGPLTDAQLRASAVAVSAASLPLPTGAATESTLSSINSKLVNGNDIGDVTINNGSGISAVNIQDGGNSITVDGTVSANQSGTWNINNISGTVSLPTGASTSANQTTANASLASIDTKLTAPLLVDNVNVGDQYLPASNVVLTQGRAQTDADNNLKVRADVLTDEGTFRDDFSGNNLSPTRWTSATSGAGSTIAVTNSIAALTIGTGNNASAYMFAVGDYGPISFRSQLTVSQRIANQTIEIGFKNTFNQTDTTAFFQFTGTDNTLVSCVSSSSTAAADLQTTTIKIPNGTSANSNDYYVEVQPDQVSFVINGQLVAQHRIHIPGPYDSVNAIVRGVNSAAVGAATTISVDYIYFINQNSLQVNNSFTGDDLPVRVKSGIVQTYGAAALSFTAANLATDIFTITGSATKTIKIKHLSVDATQTTSGIINVQLVKRSTANTAGTSTILAAVPFDSLNAAATATVRSYTANPTVGTLVGAIHNEKLFIPTTTALVEDALEFVLSGDNDSQALTLRGINEVLAVNLNGVTVAGNSFNIDVVWTEE